MSNMPGIAQKRYSVEQLGIRQAQAPRQLLRQIAASSRGALHHEYRLGKEAA